jgi:magnesium-transporting ATPase (P-type)
MNYRSYFRKRLKLRKIAFDKEEAQTMDKNTTESDKKKYPWTLKRVLAWITICAIAAMYIVTLILALLSSPGADTAFKVSLLMTFFLPIAAWVIIWAVGFLGHKKTIASFNIMNSNPKARKEMEDAAKKFNEDHPEDGGADESDKGVLK